MMLWPMSVPPPPLVSASHAWCDAGTPEIQAENTEASLQGGRKRNYPSSFQPKSCLRKHKTVIHRFCSKHPSRRFQSRAINKMGKPKTGKECREEEERVLGQVTKQWIFTIMFGLQMWGGGEKDEGAIPRKNWGINHKVKINYNMGSFGIRRGKKCCERGTGPPISRQKRLLHPHKRPHSQVNIMAL